jgi:hypothetical protein
MTVRLNIDRLVLDGVALTHAERAALPGAIQAELSRHLGGRAPATELAPQSPIVARVGREVAGAVRAALPPNPSRP